VPQLLSPEDNHTFCGNTSQFTWSSVGTLAPGDAYLFEVYSASNVVHSLRTRSASGSAPDSIIPFRPGDGRFRWQVVVVGESVDAAGNLAYRPLTSPSASRHFYWKSDCQPSTPGTPTPTLLWCGNVDPQDQRPGVNCNW
jgi:hypothetical protein